jgi:hypothetical protein
MFEGGKRKKVRGGRRLWGRAGEKVELYRGEGAGIWRNQVYIMLDFINKYYDTDSCCAERNRFCTAYRNRQLPILYTDLHQLQEQLPMPYEDLQQLQEDIKQQPQGTEILLLQEKLY